MTSSDVLKKRKASPTGATASTKKPKRSSVAETKARPETNGNKSTVREKIAMESKSRATIRESVNRTKDLEAALSGKDLPRSSSESASEVEEDQTEALLAGFSSDSESEDEKSALTAVEGLQLPIPNLPTSRGLEARLKAASSKDGETQDSERSGVIYVSRIPHGFYEHQMTAYFSQFGDISRLRMARNRRTGASKHYAFIEFVHSEVANIVAETMNNYLMFGHSLKVRVLDPAHIHPDLFKGANKRFRAIPWNRIERTRLAKTDRTGWGKRIDKENRRRMDKRRMLHELGYTFEMPELRNVKSVPTQTSNETLSEAGIEQGVATLVDSKPAEQDVTIDDLLKSGSMLAEPEHKLPTFQKATMAKAAKAKKKSKHATVNI